MIRSIAAFFALLCVTLGALAQSTPPSATITFQRPTAYVDGSALASTVPVTYRVYQGVKGQLKTMVGEITTTSQTVSSGLQAGVEYCWSVTAVANALESAQSNEGCKAFPFVAPGTVVITVK